MPDSRHPDRFSAVGQLVEDPIGSDPQGVETAEFSPQRISSERLSLKEAERILDRIDQRPVQRKQIATRAPSENESRQESAGGRSAFCEFAAKFSERDRLVALDLPEPVL